MSGSEAKVDFPECNGISVQISEALDGSGRCQFCEFDAQRDGMSSFCSPVPGGACCPTAGIIANVTLMGTPGSRRGRRIKLQAQPGEEKNGNTQGVLFTTCAQRGTVCQIFISTGLIHKSWTANVGEPTLSLLKAAGLAEKVVLRLCPPRVPLLALLLSQGGNCLSK